VLHALAKASAPMSITRNSFGERRRHPTTIRPWVGPTLVTFALGARSQVETAGARKKEIAGLYAKDGFFENTSADVSLTLQGRSLSAHEPVRVLHRLRRRSLFAETSLGSIG
jgi:hypothetical protein